MSSESVDSYVDLNDGNILNPNSYPQERTSDYIKIDSTKTYHYQTWIEIAAVTDSTIIRSSIAFYDKDKSYISQLSNGYNSVTIPGTYHNDYLVDSTNIPEMSAYVRLSWRVYGGNNSHAMFGLGIVTHDWSPAPEDVM